jgi:hypothetical protein
MALTKQYDPDAEGGITGSTDPEWAPPEQDEQSQASLKEALKARGYQIDDSMSDADIVDQLADAAAELAAAPDSNEIEQYKAAQPVLADYAQNAAEYQEYKKRRAEYEKRAAEQQQSQGPKWEMLQEDPSWRHLTKWDVEKDQWVPANPYGVQAAADRNEYTRKFQDRARRLAAGNPFDVVREAGFDDYMKQTREELRKELLQEIEQRQANQSLQYQLQEDIESNKSVLFQVDASGSVVRDGSGNPVRSPIGDAYASAIQLGQSDLGIADPAKLHKFAMLQVQPMINAAQSPPEDEQTEAAPRSKKQTFVEKAKEAGRRKTRDPNEGASIARAAARSDAQAKGKSWSELIKETEAELV